MTSVEVLAALKQRHPMIAVDSIDSLEEGKSIRAIKNVTANDTNYGIDCSGASLPGTSIVEAIGQSASILFTQTTGIGTGPEEFLVLGSIREMKFPKPVIAGDRMVIDIHVCKFIGTFAVVDALVTVDQAEVAKGQLTFARGTL
jgi:3-hydroxyacyl-[acyl-carrier-protein] dehydratase